MTRKRCRCDHPPHRAQCPHPDGCWCDTFNPKGLPPQVRVEPDVRTAQLSDESLAILRGMPEWATKGIRGLR